LRWVDLAAVLPGWQPAATPGKVSPLCFLVLPPFL